MVSENQDKWIRISVLTNPPVSIPIAPVTISVLGVWRRDATKQKRQFKLLKQSQYTYQLAS